MKQQEEKQMKKLFVVTLALFFVAGMVASAYAEDRLSLDGSYRVRARYDENFSDYDDDAQPDDERQYWDQRFRLGGKIQVAEGLSAHFRIDLAEVQWGQQTSTNRGWNRGSSSNVDSDRQIQVDRAYARWERDYFILNAGQAFTSFGNQIVVDQNQFGFVLRLKLPVVVDLAYSKIDESGSLNDSGDNDDVDFYGGQATYKADNWSAGVLLAQINDGTNEDNSPGAFGFFGSFNFGMFAFNGELDAFFGDGGSGPTGSTVDAKGIQLYLDAKANILPNLTLGGEFFWADSYSDAATETQVTGLTDSGSWSPMDRESGFADTFGTLQGIANVTGGTAKGIPEFDPSGNSAGSIGFQLYGQYRFLEKFMVQAGFMYLTPNDDALTILDNVSVFNVGLLWDCLPNTTVRVGYNMSNPDFDGVDSDNAQGVIGQLQLTW